MIWGVNIHRSYAHLPPSEVLYIAKALGLTSIRVDVYEADHATIGYLRSLLGVAEPLGLSILPVLVEPNASAIGSERETYRWGLLVAQALTRAVPAIRQWEAGNELDLRCGIPGNTGEEPSHFDNAKYALCRGAIRGMYEGFKTSPHVEVGVNMSGRSFGFLDRLRADGVPWDITTWHIYINPGTPAAKIAEGAETYLRRLASYGKPISITEFNQQDGHLSTRSPRTLLDMMSAIGLSAASKRVISAYIYELLDEPHLAGGEATYGLANTHGTLNALGAAVKARLVP